LFSIFHNSTGFEASSSSPKRDASTWLTSPLQLSEKIASCEREHEHETSEQASILQITNRYLHDTTLWKWDIFNNKKRIWNLLFVQKKKKLNEHIFRLQTSSISAVRYLFQASIWFFFTQSSSLSFNAWLVWLLK
jgi:hypothetical protein